MYALALLTIISCIRLDVLKKEFRKIYHQFLYTNTLTRGAQKHTHTHKHRHKSEKERNKNRFVAKVGEGAWSS